MYGNGISSEDFVTRDELEEAKREMQLYDDGSTTRVERTSAGQMVTCTLPVAREYEENPIFKSRYNATTSKFEISWRSFDVQVQHYAPWIGVVMSTVSANTFELEASVVEASLNIDLHLATIGDENQLEMYWTNGSEAGTIADSYTESHRILAATGYSIGVQVQRFTRPSDYPLTIYRKDIAYSNNLSYYIPRYYRYDGTTLRFIVDHWFSLPNGQTSGAYASYNPGASFNNYVIVGWTKSTNAKTVDSYANRFGYDDYRLLAYARTDASGNLRGITVYVSPHTDRPWPFGHTGSWNNGTQTVYANYGLVYKVV